MSFWERVYERVCGVKIYEKADRKLCDCWFREIGKSGVSGEV